MSISVSLPVFIFPRFQRQKIKCEGEQILKNSTAYPPMPLCKHTLCKHKCPFRMVIIIFIHVYIYLNIFSFFFCLHTLVPDTSPQSHTKGSAQFPVLKLVFSSLWKQSAQIAGEGLTGGQTCHIAQAGRRSLDHTWTNSVT